MTVKQQHPEYKNMLDKWDRCLDVAAGQDAIHGAAQKYLPQLLDQTGMEYTGYLTRTPFYNATWRTIVGLQGMLYRKPPVVIVPKTIEMMLTDITLDGTNLHMLSLEAAEHCLKLGRMGIFVDYPAVDNTRTTMADAVKMNLRPTMKMYTAKSIINWKTKLINNKRTLSQVVLQEEINVPKDEFEDEVRTQYRVLDLHTIDLAGLTSTVYRVRIMHIEIDPLTNQEVDIVDSTIYPEINQNYLDYIPFYFIGVDDVNWDVDEPPLIDLVDMNLMHYRVSADYEHGCHFTGLPTPVISGFVPEKNQKFNIGSMTAWVFPNANASATYLEFKGEGLNALEKNLERKEAQMAILGARMLEVRKGGGVESANTAAIHRGGEQSMLSSVAQAISIGITRALKTFCEFAGETDTKDVKFSLNRDFFPIPMDALTITAIIAGWQNGAYSFDQMFAQLQRGEVIDLDATVEEEKKKIADYPSPVMQAQTASGQVASASPKGPKTAAGTTGKAKTITQQQKGN